MASLHRRRTPMHDINVVPYIDVMLVLLIIFMVTAPLVTPGVIDLPSVSRASNAPSAPLEVMIREDQSISLRSRDARGAVLEERRISREELAPAVRALHEKQPELAVVIAADKSLRYEIVLKVMDELQREQVRVGLLVTPVAAPR